MRLAGFAVLTATLVVVSRLVSGMLLPRKDAWFLTVPLLLMSVSSARSRGGASGSWAGQFAAFQMPAIVIVAAVRALKARKWEPSAERNRAFGDLFLGLLGFAFVAERDPDGRLRARAAGDALRRAGHARGDGLRPRPRWLSAYEPDGRQLALMRLGGYSLAGLAFALALARPPAPSPLYSGNTLATAVLGLSLFAGSLRLERHPAFLYMGFAAFFLAYFGAYYFLRDLLMAVEEAARQAMGYREKLPGPFRAINGLFFNTMLAALALVFSRRWKDERLARHCHYLGVPFSIAACVYSGFEPLAALLCLGGYFVLYLLGTWVFRAPWVQYLAIGASRRRGVLRLDARAGNHAWRAGSCGRRDRPGMHVHGPRDAMVGARGGLTAFHGGSAGWPFPCWRSWGPRSRWSGRGQSRSPPPRRSSSSRSRPLWQTSTAPRRHWATFPSCARNVAAGLGLVAADVAGRWSFGFDRYAIVAGACGLIQVGLGAWLGRSSRMPQPGRGVAFLRRAAPPPRSDRRGTELGSVHRTSRQSGRCPGGRSVF